MSRPTWCSRVSTEVSDPLFRMHMVWFVFLRWLCFGARGSLLLRDVTGKLSLAIGGICPVLERGSCCCWFCGVTTLRSLGFFWMVSPADGEARDPRPASGLSASSKLKREDENEGRESIFRSVSTFKPLGFPVRLSGRALRQLRKRLWVRFPGNTCTNENV